MMPSERGMRGASRRQMQPSGFHGAGTLGSLPNRLARDAVDGWSTGLKVSPQVALQL